MGNLTKGAIMSQEKINGLILDIQKDYEENGKGKPINEWFLDAIKRKIVDIYYEDLNDEQKNVKIKEIADELKTGIQEFKKNREKINKGESIISDKLNDEQKNEMNDVICSTVDSLKSDLNKIDDYKKKGDKK
jgi:hypothetical protein